MINKKLNELTKSISKILYEYDPVELVQHGVPEDEYDSEAFAIICRLRDVTDIRSLKWIIYEVFEAYFFKENILPLSHECYTLISEEIWEEWEEVKKYSD